MKKNENKKQTIEVSFNSGLDDILGKQSVRATFKLTQEAIQSLSIVSTHLGIKQKSLFDHLIEDVESLKAIAREIEKADADRDGLIQKTYVLSRRTVVSLDETSKTYNTPRDTLVEHSIKRLLPVIEEERLKHYNRKKLFREIDSFANMGRAILNNAGRKLGKDDPVYARLEKAVDGVESARDFAQNFIEKGSIIEDFSFSSKEDS